MQPQLPPDLVYFITEYMRYPMVFEICAGIATLVFIVLAIYIIQTLIAVQRSLKKLDANIVPLAQESLNILKNTTDMTGSIKDKLEAFDPLFEGINDMSCAIKQSIRAEREDTKKPWQDTVAKVIVLSLASLKVWQQIKKGDRVCPK